MPDEANTPDPDSENVHLLDAMYNRLHLGEIDASVAANAVIRDEILLALIRIGALTKEQLSAALDRASKEVDGIAADFDSKSSNKYITEIAQQIRETGKLVTDGIRERVIDRTSEESQ